MNLFTDYDNKNEIFAVSLYGGIIKKLPCERVWLPWEDKVSGGAESQIGTTRKGAVYAMLYGPKLLRSADGGRTWKSMDITTDPPTTGYGAFTILKDDAFLLAWNDKGAHELYISRSEDYGKTWGPALKIDTAPYPTSYCGGGCGHGFTQLSDGTVMLPVSHMTPLGVSEHCIYRSKDNGRTWGDRSLACFWGWESHVKELHSGQLMIAVRYQRPQLPEDKPPRFTLDNAASSEDRTGWFYKKLFLADSYDGGYTWKKWRDVTGDIRIGGGYPGELVQLSDGAVVLLYPRRWPEGYWGTRALISRDEGQNWDKVVYILSMPRKPGYSASVVLEDDMFLTLSGERSIPFGTDQYGIPRKPEIPARVQAIRWRIELIDPNDWNIW